MVSSADVISGITSSSVSFIPCVFSTAGGAGGRCLQTHKLSKESKMRRLFVGEREKRCH